MSLWERPLGILLLGTAAGLALPGIAPAASVAYEYVGTTDAACRLATGETGTCNLIGTFRIDPAGFGAAQAAAGEFILFVNGSAFSTFFLFDAIDPLAGAAPFPNRVTTTADGTVTDFLFGASAPYTTGAAVSFRNDGWSWEYFDGILSRAVGGFGAINRSGSGVGTPVLPTIVSPVPLPGPLLPLASTLVVVAGAWGRRHRQTDHNRRNQTRFRVRNSRASSPT